LREWKEEGWKEVEIRFRKSTKKFDGEQNTFT